MKLLCQRGGRLASVVFLVALLLVPLLESGHSHAKNDLAKPCAVCVAAHHSPATTAPIVALAASIAVAAITVLASISAPVQRYHSPQSGRAPPASFSELV